MLSSHFDDMLPYTVSGGGGRRAVLLDHHHHRRYQYHRPNVEVAPSCPRCDSPNTKFCYYNNYSLSQPRYFCKGCRRYWTKGGSLRNVPVGGGCRKNRRGKAARSLAAAAVGDNGAAASSPYAVRPDVLLEGMVGSPAGGLGQGQQAVSSADKPTAADGSGIDLALLYAKFLNRQPPPTAEQCAVVPEWVDTTTSGSSDTSANDATTATAQPPDQPFPSHDTFRSLSVQASSDPAGAAALQRPDQRAEALGEELGFSVDQSCYDSLGLHTDDGGDLILQPPTWRREAKYEPFDPLPEDDAMSLHDGNNVAATDDVWSSALACHGLEAALCRP